MGSLPPPIVCLLRVCHPHANHTTLPLLHVFPPSLLTYRTLTYISSFQPISTPFLLVFGLKLMDVGNIQHKSFPFLNLVRGSPPSPMRGFPCFFLLKLTCFIPFQLLYLPFSFNLKAHSFIGLIFLMILDLDICQRSKEGLYSFHCYK